MEKRIKPRWRTIKQSKSHTPNSNPADTHKSPFFLVERIIAFITDMFMINMPILYIAYFVLGSKEAFLGNQIVIFSCVGVFGIILSLFIASSGQTPGYRYVGLKLVAQDTTEGKVPFVVAFLRYVLWIISMATLVGICIAYFRKDRKTFYDLVCHTNIIQAPKKS
ncbi:RDD family protein [uncultured Helicobacter sp.]|uniref:RDD family protein n=1 Tax=uncultured Helicobacter sp. TaxID=175537 RepID=UPI001C398516|nr:RDD family protein [Candidatus Helicobacter avicola]